MLRHLSERDALGLVEYDTEVSVAAPLTFCTTEGRARLEAALNRLRAGSTTNLSGGLLRGIELHSEGTPAVEVPFSRQRIRFGNTYRRLSDEEAESREHYGQPGAVPPNGAKRIHEWTMQLRFDSPDDSTLVKKVVYNLHPTFAVPTVEVLEPPFELTRFGWGTFVVVAKVHLHDGRILELQHELSYEQPESFRTLLLPLKDAPAGIDYIVNGIKKVRVTSLKVANNSAPNVNGYPSGSDARGPTIHLNGVSFGDWGAQRRTTLPVEQADAAQCVMALFHNKGGKERVEFTDTDGDQIAFVASVRNSKADESTDTAVVRSTFLFTDGLANAGVTKPEEICAMAAGAIGEMADKRCSLSTFGFGSDHNADLLQSLAEVGEGIYSYVENQEKIAESFGEALGGLLSTTHQNVRLTLKLAPEISFLKSFTTYPVERSESARAQSICINVGDLFAEERRDVLVSLRVPNAATEGPNILGWLGVRGFSVLAKHSEEIAPSEGISLLVERRTGAIQEDVHPQVQRHWNRHIATEALEVGQAAAKRGNLAEARRLLEAACETLSASPLTLLGDTACLGLIADLKECRDDLRHEETYRDYGSKKMACMKGSHGSQRTCYGQGFSKQYANTTMKEMGATFKANCK